MISPNRVVSSLPDTIPFIAPEEFERQMGQPFLARLGANESLFGASPRALHAMQDAVSRTNWYGDPLSFELRSQLARHHNLDPESFVIGSGIDGLFNTIANAFLEPGDRVVTTLGSYPTFNYFIHAVGAELIQVRYRDDLFVDLDGLAKKVSETGAKMVYLANPDNPSGTAHQEHDITSFLENIPERTLVLLDEAYIEFGDVIDIKDPRVIHLRTFSKAYGIAGVRVGYAYGDPTTLQPLNRIRPHFEVNIVAQAGAHASLLDDEHLPKMRAFHDLGRNHLRGLLDQVGLHTLPSATNFVLAKAGTKERAEQIVTGLREERIFIRKPGAAPLNHFIRISIGREEDHLNMFNALKSVLQKI